MAVKSMSESGGGNDGERLMRFKYLLLIILLFQHVAYGQRFSSDGDTMYIGENAVNRNKYGYINSDGTSESNDSPGLISVWNAEVYVSDTTISGYYNPKIVFGNTVIHIIGRASRGNIPHHYKSTDNGHTWNLFAEYSDSISTIPAEAINLYSSDGKLYTVWNGGLPNQNTFILFRASADDGETWPIRRELRFEWPFTDAMRGNIAGHGDTVFVSFRQDSLTCWRSFDMGQHWSNPGFIASPQMAYPASITYGSGVVGITYTRNRDSVDNVYYINSFDKGQTWTAPLFIGLSESWGGQWPEMAADSFGNVAVCWMEYFGSPYGWTGGIWCRISHDSGQTWENPVMLNTDYRSEVGTSVVIDNNYVGVAWSSTGPNNRLSYRESFDGGLNWGLEQEISPHFGSVPRLAKKGSVVGLVFYRTELIGPDRYWNFIKYIGNDDISDIDVDNQQLLPAKYALLAYPNPFNSRVMLILRSNEGGKCEITIYNVRGQLIKKINLLENHDGWATTWDATDNSGERIVSGLYIVKAATTQGVSFTKLVYLK